MARAMPACADGPTSSLATCPKYTDELQTASGSSESAESAEDSDFAFQPDGVGENVGNLPVFHGEHAGVPLVPAWCWVEPDGVGGFVATPHIDDSPSRVACLASDVGPAEDLIFAELGPARAGAFVPQWTGPSDVSPTTIVLESLPRQLSQSLLLEVLDREGYCGLYDFVFLPIDSTGQNFGYAIINLRRHEYGLLLAATLHGKTFPNIDEEESAEVCRVKWSSPVQGLSEHVKLHRNHPLNNEHISEELRPQLFSQGWPSPFPASTCSLPSDLDESLVQRMFADLCLQG